MRNGFRIMDSDMHVFEPHDLWERYIDKRFLGREPRLLPRKGHGQPIVLIDGKDIPGNCNNARDVMPISRNRRQAQWNITRSTDFAKAQGFDSKSQLEAMDMEGLDVAVLYPSAALNVRSMPGLDPQLAAAICRAYNDWLYDFCQADPIRLRGAALVPFEDPSEAIKEARRARNELGFPAVFLRSAALPDQAWYPVYWEPFFAEVEALDLAVGFHESTMGGFYPHLDRFNTSHRLQRHVLSHLTTQMVSMVDIILGGVCERFPKLRVGFLECNCGWAPSFLNRMDRHASMLSETDAPYLTLKPSEYFKRQCVIGCEGEEIDVPQVIQLMGDDNIVFSTDYPHSDSDFPHAVEEFFELPISDESRRKILWDNCARFYGLEDVIAAPEQAGTAAAAR